MVCPGDHRGHFTVRLVTDGVADMRRCMLWPPIFMLHLRTIDDHCCHRCVWKYEISVSSICNCSVVSCAKVYAMYSSRRFAATGRIP